MHFSLSTIATTALILSAAEAAPRGNFWKFGGYGRHRGHGHRGNGTAGVMPTGFGFPTGTGAAFPTAAFPTAAPYPTGNVAATEDDEDEESSSAEATVTATSIAEPIETGSSSGNTTATATTPSTPIGTGGVPSGTFPEAAGESTLSEPMVITDTFDGGMVRFGRGVTCGGQSEGGDADAVFQIEEGGTLKNVIIGADQSEGVHCLGACTIENVWWEDVCEDALTIKQESGVSYVIGGGAQGADDKVIQHNGGGTVDISGFYVTDFGKLYRSCGNCKTMHERHVVIDGVKADGGSATFVGINSNYGDTATITNSCIANTKTICEEFEGNDTGDEPTSIGEGPSASCIYTDADINAC